MVQRVRVLALACFVFVTAGCSGLPPSQLRGAWGAGEAACRAGLFVTFERRGVRLHGAGGAPMTLLAGPKYASRGDEVRIEFTAPEGDFKGAVVVGIERDAAVLRRAVFFNPRTGAARASIDPAAGWLSPLRALRRCPSEAQRPSPGG